MRRPRDTCVSCLNRCAQWHYERKSKYVIWSCEGVSFCLVLSQPTQKRETGTCAPRRMPGRQNRPIGHSTEQGLAPKVCQMSRSGYVASMLLAKRRPSLRQEPSAVIPLAGICAGAAGNRRPCRDERFSPSRPENRSTSRFPAPSFRAPSFRAAKPARRVVAVLGLNCYPPVNDVGFRSPFRRVRPFGCECSPQAG
jgi:hypothetical protein